MRGAPLGSATAAIVLALASPAAAEYDPIASGSAVLKLSPSFTKLLKSNGLKLTGRKGARVRGARVTLPVSSGRADPKISKAEIRSGGELLFRSGSKKVPLTKIELHTKPTPLFARVGGAQLKVAKAARVKLPREGFGNRLEASGLRLTKKAATRLNRRLHTDAFAMGQKLGTVRAATQPATVAVLPTGKLMLQFAPGIYAKLAALSTPVNPLFPAEHQGPTFTFPIATEGVIAPDATAANLRTAGGVEFLRLGFGQILWKDPWLDPAAGAISAEVDLQPTPTFAGKLGRVAPLATAVAPALVSADPKARTVTVAGAPVSLSADSAAQFNAAFGAGQPEFAAGEPLGTISFTAQTQ